MTMIDDYDYQHGAMFSSRRSTALSLSQDLRLCMNEKQNTRAGMRTAYASKRGKFCNGNHYVCLNIAQHVCVCCSGDMALADFAVLTSLGPRQIQCRGTRCMLLCSFALQWYTAFICDILFVDDSGLLSGAVIVRVLMRLMGCMTLQPV